MDKLQLLGFLLQDLRDSHGPEEEDLGPAILRETTKIFALMIEHGHLSRTMFDLAGLNDASDNYDVPERYSEYQTTNYPIAFVVFAQTFAEWLVANDARDQLDLVDVIDMIRETSWLRIRIDGQDRGLRVVVRSSKGAAARFREEAFVDHRSQ
jgi:hypothetical protein